ncbi:hypothetical protein BDV98DRAFT_563632 [Pterulicium gracile]|uniref:Uncharacterized protein n=1 Tax=Pterulicium gracile TaxID=1884261 RepID=A0A5C3QUH9_9AGAR|nr:hypothetical protein BDV98DRAFT_563632 [Pterula gracilis]
MFASTRSIRNAYARKLDFQPISERDFWLGCSACQVTLQRDLWLSCSACQVMLHGHVNSVVSCLDQQPVFNGLGMKLGSVER